MEENKPVIDFLIKNGFDEMEPNSYANDCCGVVIEENGYVVANNNGDTMYSLDKNIYWLIGVLTYFEFISRRYKI